MIKIISLAICIFGTAPDKKAIEQNDQSKRKTYVIVHGAWGGGWAFKEVDSLLSTAGHEVYRPTLTGQGERVHLASADVGLETHILDVVNTILFEDLDNIILVGHSYGGMVVTGVADLLPERIEQLIYLDALVPKSGESVISMRGKEEGWDFEIRNNHIIPPWVSKDQKPPMDVPHPYKTWTDAISLENQKRLEIPTTYILTVDQGKAAMDDDFFPDSQRAKNYGWQIKELTSDHNAQWSAQKELVQMLLE